MKLIIGLGNPGKEFVGTRHNVGFEIVDALQKEFSFPDFEFNKKFKAQISKESYPLLPLGEGARRADEGSADNEIMLVKPQTFMNLSGTSVRSILDFHKLTADDIIVIHDDIDIKLGTFKVATDSRSAGHNGVQNIIDQLGTQKFTRLRIGVGDITTDEEIVCRLGAHDLVLGKFSEDENQKISEIMPDVISEIKKLL